MKQQDYRRVLDGVVPGPALKGRIAARLREPAPRGRLTRRPLAWALAAALTLACLTTAAVAASPTLREAVLTLFRVEEREQLPQVSGRAPAEPDVTQAEIGSLVKAQYIRTDGYYGYACGLLHKLTWDEAGRELLEASFWSMEDGVLVPAEVDMRTTQVDVTWKGARYQGPLYWFVRAGELFTVSGETRSTDGEEETQWYTSDIPGRTDAVLLHVSRGRQLEYQEYPLLLRLDTGETEDILAGTGVENLEHAYDFTWSEDFQRLLVLCGEGSDWQKTWLCDRQAGTLTPLEELAGAEAETAVFLNPDTLLLFAYIRDEEGIYEQVRCSTLHIPTGQVRQTLDWTPLYHWWDEAPSGAMAFGSRCVRIGADGQTWVIDLGTGAEVRLENFRFEKGADFMPSPAGDKLLYYSTDPELDGLGITQLGVVDLDAGVFLAFDREGFGALYEEGIGWEDGHCVSIHARDEADGSRWRITYQF